MKPRKLLLNAAAVALLACGNAQAQAVPASVALAGNAFVTSAGAGATEIINTSGLANWTSTSTVTSIWFRMSQAGSATIALDARLAGSNSSKIRVTVNGTPFEVNLTKGAARTYNVGTLNLPAGYIKVDLQGISKNGAYFGDVSALRVSTASTLNYANDAANYYWSRRGPSVHLGYTVPSSTEYFHSEITVPQGEDAIGSYYMANGFNGGYFGIQVKSTSERWVLFCRSLRVAVRSSIWPARRSLAASIDLSSSTSATPRTEE